MAETCPHCGNDRGFTCGTCCRCGFNYLTRRFDWIKVDVDHLPMSSRDWLIGRHANYSRQSTPSTAASEQEGA